MLSIGVILVWQVRMKKESHLRKPIIEFLHVDVLSDAENSSVIKNTANNTEI